MGKIIVVEGAVDGIGKSTQYNKLYEYLSSKYKVYKYHFPTYDKYQGLAVIEYLKGNYGDINKLSPYFINSLYAMDRAITYITELKKYYDDDYVILLDRYTTSSIIYQSCLINDKQKRLEFINYITDFEYNRLNLPKPDKVIFLTADFDVITNLRNLRSSNDGVKNDIHEENIDFLKKVYDNANFIAKYLKWDIVDCNFNGRMDSIENIFTKIKSKI